MKEIGEYFKDKLEGLDSQPTDLLWDKVRKDPAMRRFNRIQRFKRWSLFVGVPAVVVLVTVITWYYRSSVQVEQIPVAEKQETHQDLISESSNTTPSEPVAPVSSTILQSQEQPAVQKTEPQVTSQTVKTHQNQEVVYSEVDKKRGETTSEKSDILSPPNNNKSKIEKREKQQNIEPQKEAAQVKGPIVTQSTADPEVTFVEDATSLTHTDPEVADEPRIFIPRGFTPNYDGENDFFKVYSEQEIPQFELYIYDRNGNMLYYSKNWSDGWDGTYQGREMVMGVYVYLLKYSTLKGDPKIEKGTFNLIR
ncbi:MAG TPA: gliding motility-associated C-terminal domain-containing protein [Bacteroidales bacterium]|nr:gliding motility-associated C-terminal domain-containing protein [Bacteroidales bacterium]